MGLRRVQSPPGNLILRGYANAVAVGILLAAALKFIPPTLSDIEFLSYTLVSDYLIPPPDPGSSFALWPVFFQAIIRSLGVVLILLLYLRGNAPTAAGEQELISANAESPDLPASRPTWAALPAADQTDHVGIIVVTASLGCYNLWLGANQALLRLNGVQPVIGSTLLVLFGAVLSLAILGLLPNPRRQWLWLAGLSFLLGLAVILGITGPGGRVVLMIAPLLLILGAACQIYGIGRLLRILQDQIGLEWRTTLTVIIATAVVYFGSQFIST